jgi:hypothetical protein
MAEPTSSGGLWPPPGPRWAYALGIAALVAVVLIATLTSPGAVSPARTAQLIDSNYSISGTVCTTASHGRQLCRLDSPSCHGTLLVAPTSQGTFTIVTANPEDLTSAQCGHTEGAAAEKE